MLAPNILTWVKEIRALAGLGVNARDVRSLAPVAFQTAKRKVVQRGFPTMLARDDVVNLKALRVTNLRSPAVFAQISCPVTNRLIKPLFHPCQAAEELGGWFFSEVLALD